MSAYRQDKATYQKQNTFWVMHDQRMSQIFDSLKINDTAGLRAQACSVLADSGFAGGTV
jgi:hypothetical protein